MGIKAQVLEILAEAQAKIEALEEGSGEPSEEVEQLKAKVAELELSIVAKDEAIASKDAELVSQKDLLKQADLLAKSIDAAIPDSE